MWPGMEEKMEDRGEWMREIRRRTDGEWEIDRKKKGNKLWSPTEIYSKTKGFHALVREWTTFETLAGRRRRDWEIAKIGEERHGDWMRGKERRKREGAGVSYGRKFFAKIIVDMFGGSKTADGNRTFFGKIFVQILYNPHPLTSCDYLTVFIYLYLYNYPTRNVRDCRCENRSRVSEL